MGERFFQQTTAASYDNFTRSLFAGVVLDEGTTPRAMSETYNDPDMPDFMQLLKANNNPPLAMAGSPSGTDTDTVWDYGALRASFYAYNSSKDPVNKRPQIGTTSDAPFINSPLTDALFGTDDYDDTAVADPSARIMGKGPEGGVYYVKGPYWWCFKRANMLPTEIDPETGKRLPGFGAKRITEMVYRDPLNSDRRIGEKRLMLLDDDEKKITLSALIKMMADNTVVFGTESGVTLNDIFGETGMARFDKLYEKIIGLADQTEPLDKDTLVPWVGDTPQLPNYIDLTIAKQLSAQNDYTPTDQQMSVDEYPGQPSAQSAQAALAGEVGMSPIVSPAAFNSELVATGTPPVFADDFGLFGDTFEKDDLVPVGIEPSALSIGVTAPDAVAFQSITDEQLDALRELFEVTEDPDLNSITTTGPTERTMTDAVTAAVAAYTLIIDAKYDEEEARLRSSLASARMVNTSHWDTALAILNAQRIAQINEYEKSLRVEQAKENLKAGIAYDELLLKYAQVQVEVERYFVDRYAKITDNELRWAQMLSGVYMQAYQINGDAMLRAATSTAENALRANIANAENQLSYESTKADIGTRANISKAENYTRACLQSAQNMLQRATVQYENLAKFLMTDSDAANKHAISNADIATKASMSNAENVLRAALALADNSVKIALQNADSMTRVSVSNAETATRASMTNAENMLRYVTSKLDADVRLKSGNQSTSLQANATNREMRLKSELADIENEIKLKALNFENLMKVNLSNNETRLKVAQVLFEARVRVIETNNTRIINELTMRTNIARTISDATFAWMSAMTNNAGALSQIISTGIQTHMNQIQLNRDFEIRSESMRWQVLAQRASLINGLADIKWKSQIQNLMVIQQTLASLGQANGTITQPSSFSNVMQVASLVADTASSIITAAVGLA